MYTLNAFQTVQNSVSANKNHLLAAKKLALHCAVALAKCLSQPKPAMANEMSLRVVKLYQRI